MLKKLITNYIVLYVENIRKKQSSIVCKSKRKYNIFNILEKTMYVVVC